MAAPRLLQIALLTALALVVAAPVATAHTAIFSADERVRGSIGLLNEPTSTYAVTGLDLCFSYNTDSPRTPINVPDVDRDGKPDAGTEFKVTLTSPSGEVFEAPLEIPFGRANCLTFENPMVLTEPGQYFADFTGNINGTTFAVQDVKAGGAVIDREDILFPAEEADEESRGLPAPAAALTFALLAALAAVRRLR